MLCVLEPSSPPSNVRPVQIESTHVNLTWEMPPSDSLNGVPKGFEIKYSAVEDVTEKAVVISESKRVKLIDLASYS